MKRIISLLVMACVVLAFYVPQTKAATKREEIVSIAKKYTGVKYTWGGETPSEGFDCSGYIQYVFAQAGIGMPRTANDQFKLGTAVEVKDLQPGDLVFYKNTYPSDGITHAGIYIGDNNFISATSSSGIKVNPLDNVYWSKYYHASKSVLPDETAQQVKPALPAGEFYDVSKSHFAYTAIYELSRQGVISGFEGSLFKPTVAITRGQAAILLNKQLKLPASTEMSFSDVSSSSAAAQHIAAVAEAKIVSGYPDGTFRPNEPITRGQMAIILTRAYDMLNYDEQSVKPFSDIVSTHPIYKNVHAMRAYNVTQGYADNTYRPNGQTTRAEFSAFLYRTLTR
ncbi:S-layer homology domain-containing protein [Fictibacillus aquaticus]|uniref:C40 family peptidase n=1 Tax=Fictibacillus aquaticus TaxID=2021314 RepID=UPI0010566BB7|nr:C40 family peptidase [Fictibacillus aquaticus]